MKKFTLLFFAILCFAINPLPAQIDDGWHEVGNAAYNSTLSDIKFVSPETGYAVGSGGSFLKTENGGISWIAVNTGFQLNFQKIVFLNTTKGFLLGANAQTNQVKLLKTLDGGSTWTDVAFGGNENDGSELYFFNENIGFIAGNEWYYKTTDGGNTWLKKTFTGVYSIFDMQFITENKGFIIANGGAFSTLDGGATWTEFIFNVTTSVQFTDALTGYIANGQNNDYMKTTDGGTTWNTIPKPSIDFCDQIFFTDNNTGYAFSTDDYDVGKIAKTTDGGLHWSIIENEASHKLSAMIKHQNRLFACGTGGLIMESVDMEEFNVVQEGLFRGKLNDMLFLDSNTAIAVGEAGSIVKTTDKCASWTRLESGTSGRLWGITKTPSGNLFAVGDHNILLKSIDGGSSWALITGGFNTGANNFGEILFVDDNVGFIAKDGLFSTTDGGVNWTYCDNAAFVTSLSAPDPDTVYACGTQVLVSTNHGANWTVLREDSHINYGLHFLNGTKGIVANENKTCNITNDGGHTWVQQVFENSYFRDARMFDDQVWYASGKGGILYKTSNAGTEWELVSTSTIRNLNDIIIAPDGTGYILGDDGLILRKAITETYTLTFNVTKQGGSIVTDATVTLNGFGYPAGQYVFEGLLPGDYEYRVQRSGFCDVTGSFELAADKTEDVILNNCFEVIVNVTDYENTKLGGAAVTLGTESKNTNDQGRAIFTLSTAGSYEINISKEGYQTYTTSVNLSGGITLNYALLLEILPPEALFANSITNQSFTARWIKPANAEVCLLYVSADDFTTHLSGFDGLPVSLTQYTVDGLQPDKTYKYRLIGKNGDAESGFSNVIEVRTALHGLFDEETIGNFTVQPNPAKDFITINLPEEIQNAGYYICNNMGVVIVSAELNSADGKQQIDISRLPEGLYIMQVTSGDVKYISKFIKIK